MGVMDSIFSTVSVLYNNINPITLSGVNDIIVVKDKDGNLRCSPFQLRFSRLTFISTKNQVHIIVNGKLTEIDMTLTSQGDLLFEQEIHKYNHEFTDCGIGKEPLIVNIIQNQIDYLKKLSTDNQKIVENERKKNLKFRATAETYLKKSGNDVYSEMAKKHLKFYYILTNNENFEYLINNKLRLYSIFEFLMNPSSHHEHRNCAGPTISFSQSMNLKIEGNVDAFFKLYQVKEIENPDGIVVKLTNCTGQVFYISFILFSRLYFEMLTAKNKMSKMTEFLEAEYNKTLGWNIFKTKKYIKRDVSFSLVLKNEDLKSLNLRPGKNEIIFKISGVNRQLEGFIYLYDSNDKVVVSDIDGTITKSDIRGHIYGLVGAVWTHSGIASLYSKIARNGYKIMYLTHRPLAQSSLTRRYLNQVEQDSYSLPEGPVIHNPEGVMETVYAEIIVKRPEKFKIDCLTGIKNLFQGTNPFVAGFGNKITDVISYKSVNIPTNRIYTIDHCGQIQAEYSKGIVGTYHTINEFVDSIFPPISNTSKYQADSTFSEFKYWRY